jgi:penicillin-binding protein 2
VREIKPKARNKVPVSARVLDYIRSSLAFTPANGASGSVAFSGFPLDRVLVGGKTGTAEVFGKQDTSWFASWAPATGKARYVVVATIEQAGLGAQAAAPVARAVYEGIYGLNGKKAAFPRGVAPTAVPKVTADAASRSDRHPPAASGTPGSPAPAPATPGPPAATRSPRRRRGGRRPTGPDRAPRRAGPGSGAGHPVGRPRAGQPRPPPDRPSDRSCEPPSPAAWTWRGGPAGAPAVEPGRRRSGAGGSR